MVTSSTSHRWGRTYENRQAATDGDGLGNALAKQLVTEGVAPPLGDL